MLVEVTNQINRHTGIPVVLTSKLEGIPIKCHKMMRSLLYLSYPWWDFTWLFHYQTFIIIFFSFSFLDALIKQHLHNFNLSFFKHYLLNFYAIVLLYFKCWRFRKLKFNLSFLLEDQHFWNDKIIRNKLESKILINMIIFASTRAIIFFLAKTLSIKYINQVLIYNNFYIILILLYSKKKRT